MSNQNLIKKLTFIFQYLLIFIDVLSNLLSDFNEINSFLRLSLYIIQDVSLLIALIIIILLLFQKHILLNKLLKKTFYHFSYQLILILLYLIFTFIIQSINITTANQKSNDKKEFKNKIYLLILQRMLAALYYIQFILSSDQLLTQRFIQTIKQS